MSMITGDVDTGSSGVGRPQTFVKTPTSRDCPSSNLVQWFLDYYWIRHPISGDALASYRLELLALDHWLANSRKKKLVSASRTDLQDYFDSRYRSASNHGGGLPSMSCIKRFYFYLVEVGFRDDDPTDRLYVRTPRNGGATVTPTVA
jgi:site-specific recombinase XerD